MSWADKSIIEQVRNQDTSSSGGVPCFLRPKEESRRERRKRERLSKKKHPDLI
jgi:hypothetical protein